MPTLKELNAKAGDKFKRDNIKEFIVDRVEFGMAFGATHWSTGEVIKYDAWSLEGCHDWERIEESPEAVTEPPQHVYAYLAAQYGIVIIADGVTYDGTKQ